jgi:endonuclease/exonuclease/phosphatase family metal-dependent hydrolase
VYNTHFPLTEDARERAARIILARAAWGASTDAVLVSADFNAGPGAPCRRLFDESGLKSSAEVAGAPTAAPTYQFYGIRLRSLDEILVNRGCRVLQHGVLDVKPGNTFPSDHFGVLTDLKLRNEAIPGQSNSALSITPRPEIFPSSIPRDPPGGPRL